MGKTDQGGRKGDSGVLAARGEVVAALFRGGVCLSSLSRSLDFFWSLPITCRSHKHFSKALSSLHILVQVSARPHCRRGAEEVKSDQSGTKVLAFKPSALRFLRGFLHPPATITTSSPPPQHPQQAAEGGVAILKLPSKLPACCGGVGECEKAASLRGDGAACLLHLLIALALIISGSDGDVLSLL